MNVLSIEEIRESNRLKKETCESCIEGLRGTLSEEQLKKFEEVFYMSAANVILEKKC